MLKRSPHSDLHPPIFHVATGGTLDSVWNPSADTAVPAQESIVPHYLRTVARIPGQVENFTPFLKDSRQTSLTDRRTVAAAVAESVHRHVLVTTGTFLMADIARMIEEHKGVRAFKSFGGKVAITGALTPMRGFALSDGGFNLGMSIALLQQELSNQIFLVMNGSCFDAQSASKDLTVASFGSNSGKDLLKLDDLFVVPAGGSIDFEPDGLDAMVPASRSIVPDFLRQHVNLNREMNASTLCIKDSTKLTQGDKDNLASVVRDVDSAHILVTMGIYRIREVMGFLRKAASNALREKRVVLTGARMPLRCTDLSDGAFNLGFAIGTLPFMNPGVHTMLSGRICESGEDPIHAAYTASEIGVLHRRGLVR